MNNRMKKKAEKGNRKFIHQLLDVVLDINGLSQRRQEITGDSPTAFLNFSGHIGTVEVQVNRNGWKSGANYDLRVQAHTYQPREIIEVISQLKLEMGNI